MASPSDEPDLEGSWDVNSSTIPKEWTKVFVKCYTGDVPKDLEPGSRLKVADSGRKRKRQVSYADDDSDEEAGLDLDEDEPDWNPGKEEREEDDDEEEEEEVEMSDLEDSDEDPGWQPGKKRKTEEVPAKKKFASPAVKKPKTTQPRPKQPQTKQPQPQAKKQTGKKSKNSGEGGTMSDGNISDDDRNIIQPDESIPSTPCTLTGYRRKQPTVEKVVDSQSSGPQPEVGDFLLETDSVKDGFIPFLWRFKRGGLIQKYTRLEEGNTVCFQNALFFSDWWSCYSHKFIPVETKVMYKYRALEKVTIVKLPELEGLVEQTVGQHTEDGSGAAAAEAPQDPDKNAEAEKEKEPESEVSSTTNQIDPEYQTGMFVMDRKDLRNVDNFPIWRIESGILLRKFQMRLKSGRMVHKPVRVYRGYRDIATQYKPVKTRKATGIDEGDSVEVEEDSRPKLFMDSSTEEKYEKNPLLRHFYVYLQVFLSQALEPGFLKEIYKGEDVTYILPLTEIDKIIEQKMNQIENHVKWKEDIQTQLKKCPYLREVAKPDQKSCEGLQDTDETVEEVIFLFGDQYDPKTLRLLGRNENSQDFNIGKTAAKYVSAYHQLCHYKYNLYDKCLAKVKMVRDTKSEDKALDVEELMDDCLGNKQWVLQKFEDFLTLIQK